MAQGRRAPSEAPWIDRPLLVIVLGLIAAAHVRVALFQNVNWDEFWFLSFIYDYSRGTLTTLLQTFHVHLFGWLTRVDGHEVEQVVVARSVFLPLLVGTCACVYILARRAASVNGSLFAVLCCAGFSNILDHGTAFRTDGLCVFLLMTACVVAHVTVRRSLALVSAAMLVAVALLISIKSIFLLPTVVLLLVTGHQQGRLKAGALREVLQFSSVLVGATLVLYFWHRAVVGSPTAEHSIAILQSAATKVVERDVLFPGLSYFVASVLGNLVQWSFLAYAVVVLGRRLSVRQQTFETSSQLALALPLLSLVFYRNAFPYFYVLVMPPALVLCALSFDELTRRGKMAGHRGVPIAFLATLAIAGTVTAHVLSRFPDGTTVQREVIRAVHDMFPQPVPYIDRNGMIASFPKVGFFMSTWGMENYNSASQPIFADLLRTSRPQFVIVNSPALLSAFSLPHEPQRREHLLLEEDVVVLRRNFVQLWGPVYVLGTHVRLEEAVETTWDVLAAGTYELVSEGPVRIGQTIYEPGARIQLAARAVPLRSEVTQEITLRLNVPGRVPPNPAPTGPLYIGL